MAEPKYQSINVNVKSEDKPLFCFGCKIKHTLDDVSGWSWTEAKVNNKTVRYCRLCLNCDGCKKIHKYSFGFRSSPAGTFCDKWYKSAPLTLEQKEANMSPEEVMSGVQHGNPLLGVFKGKSSNNYSEEVKEQQKELKEALG